MSISKILLSFLVLVQIYASFAKIISGKKANSSIKVEKKDDLRRFSLCNKQTGKSRKLGTGSKWYRVEHLQDQRNWEISQAVLSTAGAAAAKTLVGAYAMGATAIIGGVS